MSLGIGIGISAVLQQQASGGPAYYADLMQQLLPPGASFQRASAASFYNSAGQLTTATTDQPRYDFDPATGRTNLIVQSGQVGISPWSVGASAGVTANAGIGVAGGNTAGRVVFTANNAGALLRSNLATVANATTYTASVWLRADVSGVTVTLRLSSSGGAAISPNTNCVLTTSWQRFTVTVTSIDTGLQLQLRGSNDINTNIYVDQAQLEIGSIATDYIPTTAAAVTQCVLRGLLMEEQRTNYFLNSSAPVTQTITLSAGTYTVWCGGPAGASVTTAAGTATGSGFGTATAGMIGTPGTPNTFTLTGAGTVTVTMGGTAPTTVQCENGSFPTSLVPTTTSAATRAPDYCFNTNISSWFNAAEGTQVLEYIPSNSSTGALAASLQNSDSISRITLGNSTAGVFNAGTQQLNFVYSVTPYAVTKQVLAYKTDDCAGSLNGGTVQTDTSVTLPTNVDRLYLGGRQTNAQLNGWVRRYSYYRTRMANSQLQALTA